MTAESETCPQCDGTGRDDNECWCGGEPVTGELAEEHGYPVDDGLTEWDPGEDTYECPRCRSDACRTCEGVGEVPAGFSAHERERVLLTALWDGEIFPRIETKRNGRVIIDREALLCAGVAADLREENKIRWMASLFGDEISLTRDGWYAAMSLYDDGTSKFMEASDVYGEAWA